MQINIKTKNIELTGALEVYIQEKVGKLEKFLSPNHQEVIIEIERETNHHHKGDVFGVEIIINGAGKKFITKSHGEDLMKLIIEAKDQMEIEVKKHKEKRIDINRRQAMKESNQL